MHDLAPAQLHPCLQYLLLFIRHQPQNRPNKFPSRPLHIIWPFPGKLFLQMFTWFIPSCYSRLLKHLIREDFSLFHLILLSSTALFMTYHVISLSIFSFPHQNANPMRARAFLCSLLHSQGLDLCLTHSRYSLNIRWLYAWPPKFRWRMQMVTKPHWVVRPSFLSSYVPEDYRRKHNRTESALWGCQK